MGSLEFAADGVEHHFGMWAVGFVDLLGQKDAFLNADFIPESGDEESRTKFLSALRNSLGAIYSLYDALDRFEQGFTEGHDFFHDLPPDQRAFAATLTSRVVRTFRWSDGIVLATPLEPREDHNPIMGVWKLVGAMGSLLSVQLAKGRPIRGGIDIGVATEALDQLFGSALVKAYVLESKHAKYPRVVVGADFVEYLEVHTRDPGSDVASQTTRKMAHTLRDFVVKDTDGEAMLDVVGKMSQAIPGIKEPGLLERALEFARSSRVKFREDEKLFGRYSQLVRYLESRI